MFGIAAIIDPEVPAAATVFGLVCVINTPELPLFVVLPTGCVPVGAALDMPPVVGVAIGPAPVLDAVVPDSLPVDEHELATQPTTSVAARARCKSDELN
jgi:hypothetical protein